MFSECSNLSSIDISKFNTSNVENMNEMFSYCSSLTSIDLKNFDTKNLKSMNGMFQRCSLLSSIDLSSFNITKLKDIDYLFYNCKNLSYIDISSFSNSLEYNNAFIGINSYGTIIVNEDLEELIKSLLNNENWNITIKE